MINTKWDPTTPHLPDFFTDPTPNEVGPSYNLNTKEMTHTLNPFCTEESLKDCFRVFTDRAEQLLGHMVSYCLSLGGAKWEGR